MSETLTDQIVTKIDQVAELYYRLVIMAAPSGSGKTAVLQQVSRRVGGRCVNVNLELSRRLLDLTVRQRSLQVPRLLSAILDESESDVVLLDNIEMLFDPSLKQDPLQLLRGISRNVTIVVAWNGVAERGYLTYAVPGHPEYRRYPVRDFLLACPS